jgi:hypothetical protein
MRPAVASATMPQTRYYSDEQALKLELHRRRAVDQNAMLQIRVTSRIYKSGRGKEHATHGFGRRLRTLIRAIDQVFTILPPERTDIPVNNEVIDATIAIQSFVLNIVGCFDNLAWVWVYENRLRRALEVEQ